MNDTIKIILLFALISLLIFSSASIIGMIYSIPSGNVAMIKLHNEIVSFNSLLGEGQSSDSIISLLESAESNPNVKAIILSINSVGGMGVASKEVSNVVLNISKPVIAWIREVGTSGAYLIASSSDYIICDELSMTGSIGSTMSYLEFSETLNEYGVEYERLVSGEFKDMGSMYRNMTDEEYDMFMVFINNSFEYFLNHVVTQRELTNESIDIISDGRIIIGSQALELGLVDELGSKNEIINYLESINITNIIIDEYSTTNVLLEISDLII